MKKRIQYLYEKGGDTAWFQMMMNSESLTDLLNNAEYTQKMYTYDRKCLDKYANTITEVQKLEDRYQQEKAELEGMKQEQETSRQTCRLQLIPNVQAPLTVITKLPMLNRWRMITQH